MARVRNYIPYMDYINSRQSFNVYDMRVHFNCTHWSDDIYEHIRTLIAIGKRDGKLRFMGNGNYETMSPLTDSMSRNLTKKSDGEFICHNPGLRGDSRHTRKNIYRREDFVVLRKSVLSRPLPYLTGIQAPARESLHDLFKDSVKFKSKNNPQP